MVSHLSVIKSWLTDRQLQMSHNLSKVSISVGSAYLPNGNRAAVDRL